MPSKRRWALNPRKWFGAVSHAKHKQDNQNQINEPIITLPQPVIRIIPMTSTAPRTLTSRNQPRLTVSSNNYENNYTNSTNSIGSYVRFQLPTVNANTRREKMNTVIPTTTTVLNRPSVVIPTRVEPSIQKGNPPKEDLAIDTTRWTTETSVFDLSKSIISLSLTSQHRKLVQRISVEKSSENNLRKTSDPCFIYCPEDSSTEAVEKKSDPSLSSESSIDENDEPDQSSSSGIFTDERTDTHDRLRTESKGTLSTIEVLSVESIADSQTSLDNCPSRPLAPRYRMPISRFETTDEKLSQLEDESTRVRSQRAQSAESLLKDSPITTPVITKSRQSSAAIVKKIEKRLPVTRSPPITLEKAGFVRVANATYRLNVDKDEHLYRRHRQNSFIHYLQHEDSLPPATDEESYATLPRISSTEQLNTNIQDNLRAIVDDYLRPMAHSVNEMTVRSNKKPSQHRSKRSQMTNACTQINIEDITDKLISSMDCSTYSQYQRCY